MGPYAPFEHYLTTLEIKTCPEFWPPAPVVWPAVRPWASRNDRTRGKTDRRQDDISNGNNKLTRKCMS